ncbi:hypothetical protein P3T37_004975 [Kitasatospora sp. MAA4]|uniref:hypothetical protein n=1 Tax=Kitasatospora sp. MAA4 TaxID=3035093 RepID=UPI00247354A0|nr:hypothetical protein [Kitasatospora sp. MAA4]MDH6135559.1 hypothetical protein [Kitasatospora sp. MAA4]
MLVLPRGYRPLFAPGPFRRLLPALAVSDLGDGTSVVAVAWLALRLAPPGDGGPLVGAAVAAYALPGALGALLLGGRLRRLSAGRPIRANAWTRCPSPCSPCPPPRELPELPELRGRSGRIPLTRVLPPCCGSGPNCSDCSW